MSTTARRTKSVIEQLQDLAPNSEIHTVTPEMKAIRTLALGLFDVLHSQRDIEAKLGQRE
jgi:hypothetical protein